jgi:Spy/CpxP family protein refolding chaperone
MKKLSTLFLATALVTTLHVMPALAGDHDGAEHGKKYGASDDAHKGKDYKKGKHHKGKMLKYLDENKDGVVSKSEFLGAQEKRFDKMDADGDGSVTQDEMQEAHKKFKEKMKEKREKYKAEHGSDE